MNFAWQIICDFANTNDVMQIAQTCKYLRKLLSSFEYLCGLCFGEDDLAKIKQYFPHVKHLKFYEYHCRVYSQERKLQIIEDLSKLNLRYLDMWTQSGFSCSPNHWSKLCLTLEYLRIDILEPGQLLQFTRLKSLKSLKIYCHFGVSKETIQKLCQSMPNLVCLHFYFPIFTKSCYNPKNTKVVIHCYDRRLFHSYKFHCDCK